MHHQQTQWLFGIPFADEINGWEIGQNLFALLGRGYADLPYSANSVPLPGRTEFIWTTVLVVAGIDILFSGVTVENIHSFILPVDNCGG